MSKNKTVTFYCPVSFYHFPGMTYEEFSEIDDCYEDYFLEDYKINDTADLKADAEIEMANEPDIMREAQSLKKDFPDILSNIQSASIGFEGIDGRLWLRTEFALQTEVDTNRLRDFAGQCISGYAMGGGNFQKGADFYLMDIKPYEVYNQTTCVAPPFEENLLMTEEEMEAGPTMEMG